MRRRRFLQIFAAAALSGRAAQAAHWRGQAFGADIDITLRGGNMDRGTLAAIQHEVEAIETCFSLHRDSELTRLNAQGHAFGSHMLREVLALAQRVHVATGGAFDPMVQPLWAALSNGQPPLRDIGPQPVVTNARIQISQGQAMTLNGIVQGFAADQVRALLAQAGYRDLLVNMGEFAALDERFDLGVEDPAAGLVGQLQLSGGEAMATSSPQAIWLPGGTHILGPHGQRPQWSSVTVRAPSAALADACSTAFVLMGRADIAQAARALDLQDVYLVDFEGNFGPL